MITSMVGAKDPISPLQILLIDAATGEEKQRLSFIDDIIDLKSWHLNYWSQS